MPAKCQPCTACPRLHLVTCYTCDKHAVDSWGVGGGKATVGVRWLGGRGAHETLSRVACLPACWLPSKNAVQILRCDPFGFISKGSEGARAPPLPLFLLPCPVLPCALPPLYFHSRRCLSYPHLHIHILAPTPAPTPTHPHMHRRMHAEVIIVIIYARSRTAEHQPPMPCRAGQGSHDVAVTRRGGAAECCSPSGRR